MTTGIRRRLFAVWLAVCCVGCAATARPTLRELYGISEATHIPAPRTALVLVDFQREFFEGRLPLDDGPQALQRAVALRAWARAHGVLVIHVRNVVERPDSLLFAIGSRGAEFVGMLAPRADEIVITKHLAGAFSKTELDALLRARGIQTLVVAGLMTHLAVDTTARDAAVLGYEVTVAADACATRALRAPLGSSGVEARELHRVALAALADRFASVLRVRDIEGLPVSH